MSTLDEIKKGLDQIKLLGDAQQTLPQREALVHKLKVGTISH